MSLLFYLFDIEKLKFYFSCFYLCSKEVRHIGNLLPVSHICLQIAFPVSHIGFTISYNFSLLYWNGNWWLLCSWITATLIWYIGSYMLLPIDFNGKLEIFLKHLKKKIFFWFSTQITLKFFQVNMCQPCWILKKIFCVSHVLTCNFNFSFNQPSPCMIVMWVWILFNLEYAWLNFSYPHSNLFLFHLVIPP